MTLSQFASFLHDIYHTVSKLPQHFKYSLPLILDSLSIIEASVQNKRWKYSKKFLSCSLQKEEAKTLLHLWFI